MQSRYNVMGSRAHVLTLNTPRASHTHKITVPGTTFVAFTAGAERAAKLAKQLSATYLPTPVVVGGKRRAKCVPVITELTEEN